MKLYCVAAILGFSCLTSIPSLAQSNSAPVFADPAVEHPVTTKPAEIKPKPVDVPPTSPSAKPVIPTPAAAPIVKPVTPPPTIPAPNTKPTPVTAPIKDSVTNVTPPPKPLSPEQAKRLQAENAKLTSSISELETSKKNLSVELEKMRNSVASPENVKNLMISNETIKNERDTLLAKNQQLEARIKSDSFINGGMVLFAGMIITLFIQYFSQSRKKSDWV